MKRRLTPDLGTLQTFESAARHGSFTRAAEELSLTQSAVSRQIRDIEQQTGLVLFERVRQRVVLSEAGERLLPEIRHLLQQSEQLMIAALSAGRMRTSLSVATLPTFGSRWLLPRLSSFRRRWSDIALTIGSRSSTFDFDEESFDLAIHFGRPTWPKANCIFLCDEVVLPVGSPDLIRSCRPTSPEALRDAPLIHLITRPRLWADWFAAQDIAVDNAYTGLRLDQFSMIIEGAVSGLGFALLPSYLVERELRSGALKMLFDLPLSTENSYYVVVPEKKQANETVKLFTQWLLAQVGGGAESLDTV